MNITLTDLKQKLIAAAQKHVSEQEAEYFAELTIDTHLKKAPRSNPLKSSIKDIKNWSSAGRTSISKTVDKASVTTFDFDGLAPSLKIKEIHDELVAKARQTGMAAVAVKNSGGFHTLTLWTDALQEQGILPICFVNGGPCAVVPYGAKGGRDQSVCGTNPLSFSAPTKDVPFSADMATSQIPYFELVQAKKQGKQLPKDAAVDSEGNVTTDINQTIIDIENEACNMTPLAANHKGSALVLLVELLTSSLIGSPNSLEMTQNTFVPAEHGNLIIGFDIASFTSLDTFKQSSSLLADKISSLRPKAGFDEVNYPGQRADQRKQAVLAKGEIEVDEKLVELLESLG